MNRHKINRTTQRDRDKFMPGWEEFMKLSRGIMEKEQIYSKSEQLNDDQAEELDVELLAEPPPSYNPFPDELEDDERDELEEKRKQKPDCIPGNPSHDSRGRFSTKGNEKSWSKTHPDGAANDPTCKHGQRKSKGRWTRVRCGRELEGSPGKPSKSGKKADYRCYDGKKIRGKTKNEELARQALSKLDQAEGSALVSEVVRQVLRSQSQQLAESVSRDQLQAKCKQAGFYSLEFFLDLQDQLKRSQDGKLKDEK